jgi:hypothetical protein
LACALVLAGTIGIGCGAIKNMFSSDPVGDHPRVAVRVPADTAGKSCSRACERADDACFQRNETIGAMTPADGRACMGDYWACYAACPGATTHSYTYRNMKSSVASRLACSANLPQGSRVICMWGHVPSGPAVLFADMVVDTTTSPGSTPSTSDAGVRTGDKVLARFRNGGYWFVGRVVRRDGTRVEIAYLDGTNETLPEDSVRPFDWTTGTKVSCEWKRQRKYYGGTITSLDGDNVHVRYDDGDQEDTSIAFCRVASPL